MPSPTHPEPTREQLLAELAGLRQMVEDLKAQASRQRQTEEALRASQERLRQIIDLVPHMIFAKDRDGRLLLGNKAAADAHGLTVEEYTSARHPALHRDPAELARMLADDREVIDSGRPKHIPEETYLRQDGQRRILETFKIPFTTWDTATPAVLGVAVDITEQRQAQERLAKEQAFIRQVLDIDSDLVFVKDGDGRFILVNQAMADLYGCPRADLIDRLNQEMLANPKAYAHYAKVDQKVLSGGKAVTCEEIHPCPDGRTLWFLTTKAPIRLPDGRTAVLGVAHDITARKAAEEALARRERDFRTLAEHAPDVIARLDRQFRHLYVNPAAEAVTGVSPEAFVGKTNRELGMPPALCDLWEQELGKAFASGQEVAFAFDYPARDRVRHFEARLVPEVGPDGTVVSVLGVAHDQTDLRQAKDQAEAANQAKDRFLAVLSHELRTPLTPVLAMVELLGREANLSPAIQEALAMIRRNVALEARLIDDLLDLNRLSRGKIELHLSAVDVHEILWQVVRMVEEDVQGKQIKLSLQAQARHYWMQADPARLQQVFWNLLKNAVKFTPHGGSITLTTSNPAEGRLQVAICDTGIGIAAEALPRIFDAFEQGGREVTRRFGGMGLGLAISRALVGLHGGSLLAASGGPGQGATFTVELPVAAGVPAHAHRIEEAAPQAVRAGLRILLVEDNRDTATSLARLLRNLGHQVATAETVAQALDKVNAAGFDLVISDIGLPDRSGLELMRELQSRPLRIPGIALSGYGMEEDLARSREAGFAAHLTKPVDLDALEQVIEQVAHCFTG